MLTVRELSKTYGGKRLFANLEFTLFYQERLCILGRNGCGKTTLLKIFTDEIQADEGVVQWGSNVKIGYLPQDVKYEDEELTVLSYFANQHNLSNDEARSRLAKALFLNEDVHKKISSLSGGEKSRLKLCSLTYQGVNVLILDEPTNHLDIESREELEESLCDFTGTLLFVSHDRYFIDKVADRILELT